MCCRFWIFFGVTLALIYFVIFPFFEKTIPINQTTKICLITGASTGIGCALTKEMVIRGWKVIAIARHIDALNQLAHELGPDNVFVYSCDVSKKEEIHTLSEEIKHHDLKPTLFFLNAGTGHSDTPFNFKTSVHQDTFNVNYFGVINWIEEWLPVVKTYNGATFVVTSSVLAHFAPPGAAAYCASKAAISSCFQSLRLQYLPYNINFLTVHPGPVSTRMLKHEEHLPFKQKPEQTARYIVDHVFKGEKVINPSWLYNLMTHLVNILPDSLILKALGPVQPTAL